MRISDWSSDVCSSDLELEAVGHKFETETDTETVVHLISSYLDRQMTPQQAVAAALKRLEGAFALAIIFAGRHDLMISARRGSPLEIGSAASRARGWQYG